jgi:hypothetical protein
MKNWTQRLAIFAFLGAILSSAVLVGCGGGSEDDSAAANNTTAPAGGGADAE